MIKRHKNKININDILLKHLENNIRQYLIVTLLFVIGIIIGILLVKNSSDDIKAQISTYINTFIENLKGNSTVNKNKLFMNSIKNNLKITVLMWFMGSTIIGLPLVFGIIVFKGLCIGYTISSIIGVLGAKSGIIISFLSIFIQNIVLVPAILAFGVSALNLYKIITKNRHRENVKVEILRHTIFSCIICVFILLSSFLESYVSTVLTEWYVNLC